MVKHGRLNDLTFTFWSQPSVKDERFRFKKFCIKVGRKERFVPLAVCQVFGLLNLIWLNYLAYFELVIFSFKWNKTKFVLSVMLI